ncbi:MAG: (d)CMP kinase [Oscillospiraceae bacterium]|nr:(d)CMP kinase [Oscillospiraceae bacterium]
MKSIAIDGPSGAGKSTIAKILSKKLGFIYLDTGALYRSISYKLLNMNIDLNDDILLKNILKDTKIEIKFIDDNQKIYIDDIDVSDNIRRPEISMAASKFSAIDSVRKYLFKKQIDISKKNNIIMDGRDIGTIILPNADLKIFLTANLDDRVNRRYKELKKNGMDINLEDVKRDMEKRDNHDSTRKISPLKIAQDAIIIDTTGYSLEKTLDEVGLIIKGRF